MGQNTITGSVYKTLPLAGIPTQPSNHHPRRRRFNPPRMANASSLSLSSFHFFFLFFLCIGSSKPACAGNAEKYWHTVSVDSLLPPSSCNVGKGIRTDHRQGKTTLKLVDQHGPCSPFRGNPVSSWNEQTQDSEEILHADQARVNWIHFRASNSSFHHNMQPEDALLPDSVRVPTFPGASWGTGNFIVSVGLGTPKRDFHLVFDTGSDITWVQCEPCLSCYQQLGARFSPTSSSSYRSIACTEPDCAYVKTESGSNGCTKERRCLYGVAYGDNSYSIGLYGRDTLTLSGSNAFPGFTFGCGLKNGGLFGLSGGILGLGRSRLSAVSQTASQYGRVFSYCLPSASSTGFLTFGPDPSYSSAQYTPLISNPQNSAYYFLSVTGISVAGQMLPLSSSIFSSPGTIIDSGTVITRLPPSAYGALRSAFRSSMARYPLAQPLSILDTCFDLSSSGTVQIPVIKFHFQGGSVLTMDIPNIFFIPSTSQACLAFAANNGGVAIIGNRQQRRTQIVYDVANSRIGFSPGACS